MCKAKISTVFADAADWLAGGVKWALVELASREFIPWSWVSAAFRGWRRLRGA